MTTRKKCNQDNEDIRLLIKTGSIEMLKARRVQWSKLYNYTDITGLGLLTSAIRTPRYPMLEYLLDKGFDIEFKTKFAGYTPIMYAARSNNSILQLLIERGANVHATSIKGETPLHIAVSYGFFDNTKLLLEKGSKIDCVDQEGNTPLHCAGVYHELDIFKMLIDKGASIHVKNKLGQTPLDLVKHTWNYQEILLYIKNKKIR